MAALAAHWADLTDTFAKVVQRASGFSAAAPRRRRSTVMFFWVDISRRRNLQCSHIWPSYHVTIGRKTCPPNHQAPPSPQTPPTTRIAGPSACYPLCIEPITLRARAQVSSACVEAAEPSCLTTLIVFAQRMLSTPPIHHKVKCLHVLFAYSYHI